MPQHGSCLLKAGTVGCEQEVHAIEQVMDELRGSLGAKQSAPVATSLKRNLPNYARKRISAAQKKRWAAYRAQKAAQAQAGTLA